jgi:uncharacterized protein YkwD
MRPGRRADTGNVAHLRLILLAALCALCFGAYGAVAEAPGASVASAGATHKRVQRHARARHVRCARHSSFHSTSGHPRRSKRRASCRHTRTRARHLTGTHSPGSGGAKRRAARPKAPAHTPPSLLAPGRRGPAAAHSSVCPDAGLTPTGANLQRLRDAVLCLVNRERAAHGEADLQPNAPLEQAAQGHTDSMVSGGYFEHIGPGGDTPIARMRAAGYIYSSRVGFEVGENLAWGTLWEGTPRAIVAAWMASAGHRANILNARFRDTAIGVSPHPPSGLSHGQAGGIYTQDFGVITVG